MVVCIYMFIRGWDSVCMWGEGMGVCYICSEGDGILCTCRDGMGVCIYV